jgi:uncharacterized protein YeaO (DUF488 family)
MIRTRRWDDEVKKGDGIRLLICRYRPRGVAKENETWDLWWPDLGPSRELHAAYYGKSGAPISWDEYRQRYLDEMKAQQEQIAYLAGKVAAGGKLTLLCSSACRKPSRCHRTLLKALIEERVAELQAKPPAEAGKAGVV